MVTATESTTTKAKRSRKKTTDKPAMGNVYQTLLNHTGVIDPAPAWCGDRFVLVVVGELYHILDTLTETVINGKPDQPRQTELDQCHTFIENYLLTDSEEDEAEVTEEKPTKTRKRRSTKAAVEAAPEATEPTETPANDGSALQALKVAVDAYGKVTADISSNVAGNTEAISTMVEASSKNTDQLTSIMTAVKTVQAMTANNQKSINEIKTGLGELAKAIANLETNPPMVATVTDEPVAAVIPDPVVETEDDPEPQTLLQPIAIKSGETHVLLFPHYPSEDEDASYNAAIDTLEAWSSTLEQDIASDEEPEIQEELSIQGTDYQAVYIVPLTAKEFAAIDASPLNSKAY